MTERQLFDEAMMLPPAEVPSFLLAACPDDAALRARVMALVHSSGRAEGVLPDEPAGWPADWSARAGNPGQAIGRYRLESIVGEGGFGVVWRAQQQEPVRRTVALKILKPGLDTHAVVARFEAERQTLAMMDHPNVAHVYDAGATPAGRPYFVMEYLEGEPLFLFAAQRRLTVAGRLSLMEQAAAAVQHAHQKGIIHRDLKPSNIIVVEVDARPVPKIIDFGIARTTEPERDADLTLAGQRWGTPAYMSPEQLDGRPVDTRTDIYSLGVILYELIAGVPAMARRNPAPLNDDREMVPPSRRVTRLTPDESVAAAGERSTTPRQLAGQLRGELDWIVMKSVAIDPARRYDSAGALREDLLRFQAGQPVTAGPPTARYRAGKFIRRHKVKLAAAAATVLALIAGTIVSLVYARRAHDATTAMADALYDARLTEARAVRQTGRPGQRLQALASVAAAAKYRPTAELRDEALAAMALPDVAPLASMDVLPESGPVHDYDFVSDLLVVGRHDRTEVERYRLTTGGNLGPLPLPPRAAGSFKMCLNPGASIIALYPAAILQGLRGPLAFFEAATGRLRCEVEGADFEGHGCEFIDGGAVAIIPMEAGGLSVLDLKSGRELRRLETGGRVSYVRANPDGSQLLACRSGERKILCMDAVTGEVRHSIMARTGGTAASFSADGRFAAFSDMGGGVGVVDLNTAVEGPNAVFAELAGHASVAIAAEFVLGGQFVISSSWDNTVRLWNPAGQQWLMLDAATASTSLDGRRLFVTQGKRVQLFELIAPEECRTVTQLAAASVPSAAFSADGHFMALPGRNGTLLGTWPEARVIARIGAHHYAAAFDPVSPRLFTAGRDGVHVWDLASMPASGPLRWVRMNESQLVAGGNHWNRCTISPDGRWLAAVSGESQALEHRKISVFNTGTLEEVTAIPWTSTSVQSLVFDPAGRWLAASWWRGDGFTAWETDTWKPLAKCATEVESMKLAVNQDGTLLASCSSSELCLWDTEKWQPVRRVPGEPTSSKARPVACSPRGLVAFVYDAHRIRLVRAGDGGTVATLTMPLRDEIAALDFTPDGKTLAASTPRRTYLFDLHRIGEHLSALGLAFGP